MSRFELQINVTSKQRSAENVQKTIQEVLDKAKIEASVTESVKKRKPSTSRAERLSDALALVDDALGEIESLKGELEDWRDNLPENLQQGGKADELNEAIDALDGLYSEIDSAKDSNEVNFPGMF